MKQLDPIITDTSDHVIDAEATVPHHDPILRILHLRDDVFLLLYLGGLIEMRILREDGSQEVLKRFQIPHEADVRLQYVTDIDFKGDESNILLGFGQNMIGFLNLVSGAFQFKVLDETYGWRKI